MTYTKGEWRLQTDAQGACMIMHPTEKGYALANLSDTFSPANGMWYSKDWDESYPAKRDEREANAQLIASAADLYEALKAVMDEPDSEKAAAIVLKALARVEK